MRKDGYWHDIPTGPDPPRHIYVIVEIPKGSQNKYEYDKNMNIIRLDRVLFSPLHYPGDYGIIPQTLAEDGDPLDALVLVTYPTYPGILIEARPVGMLRVLDQEVIDDKILCVPIFDPRFHEYRDISDLEEHILREISHFFQVYKELEGKAVKILGWKSVKDAEKIILKSVDIYREKFGKD
jgi:inorganic pyrophosphatase